MVSVLVTGIGSTPAISVVKGLRQQNEIDVYIVGTDINNRYETAGSVFCDKFYKVPPAVDPDYISILLNICEKENIAVAFPIIDIELEVIASHIEAFRSRGVHVWVSDIDSVRVCNDKYHTYRFLLENGFPVPATWLPEEVNKEGVSLPYPLVIKPRDGRSSIDVFYVDNSLELQEALKKVKNPIIQEYIAGKEYTIDVVADMESRVLAVVPRERIEIKAGISYKGRTVKDDQLINLATEISLSLKIKGPCNLQCKLWKGKPKCFEINPRFSGTLPLTIAAGINSPLILIKQTLGIDSGQLNYSFQPGVYMARYWEEVFYYGD